MELTPDQLKDIMKGVVSEELKPLYKHITDTNEKCRVDRDKLVQFQIDAALGECPNLDQFNRMLEAQAIDKQEILKDVERRTKPLRIAWFAGAGFAAIGTMIAGLWAFCTGKVPQK